MSSNEQFSLRTDHNLDDVDANDHVSVLYDNEEGYDLFAD